MKLRYLIIGLVLLVLAACDTTTREARRMVKRAERLADTLPDSTVSLIDSVLRMPASFSERELSAIDSLMWRQPDSALACLIPYFDTCCRDAMIASPDTTDMMRRIQCVSTTTTFNRHYANLLLAELLYKNDYDQANRSALQQAVAYFDSLTHTLNDTPKPKRLIAGTDPLSLTRNNNLAFLDARAHYINGVGYYENDSMVEACAEYLKALEVMESRFEEKELTGHKARFMAFTYTRLTDLFSDLYLHEQAIYFAQNSLAYYNRPSNPLWYTARMLNEIGSQFDMMKKLDSAVFYYQTAIEILDDTATLLYRDIATHLAYLKYNTNNQTESALIELYYLLSESENEKEYCSRCAIIGEIYYHEKLYDSAWIYLNKVFHNSQSKYFKKQVAEWLVEICRVQNRNTETFDYVEFLVPFANQEENQSEIKSHLAELYNAFRQAKLSRRHRQMVKRSTTIGLVIVGGLIVGLLVYVFLYHNNKRRKQFLEKQFKEEQLSHNMKQKALSGRLKRSNEELRKLKDQMELQNSDKTKTDAAPAATFTEEPICRLILENVKEGKFKSKVDYLEYKTSALSKQQLYDLRVAADQHFDQFTVRLKIAYPQLTNSDLDYCCLYLFGLTDADIAALIQRAYNTVVERDSKIKKVLGNDNPLPITLIGIARNCLSI